VLGNPVSLIDPKGLEGIGSWTYAPGSAAANGYEAAKNKTGGGIFVFGSASRESPGPVRLAIEEIGVLGWDSEDGFYGAEIQAAGVEVGGHDNYVAGFKGQERTTDCGEWKDINILEGQVGLEVPMLGGVGVGAGTYNSEGETGVFMFIGGGFGPVNVSVGIGIH